MQATSDAAVRTARLADEDRDELEALRGEESEILWKKAVKVYEIHEQYKEMSDVDWPRSEVADACGVQPRDADEMVNTFERVGWFYECVGYEDICYNAWKYIARHDDPQAFLDEILDDMANYSGKFPPVSVIRMKLAKSKGNPPPDKPREWAGCRTGFVDMLDDEYLYITVRVPLNGRTVAEIGLEETPVTLTEATDAAGRATRAETK